MADLPIRRPHRLNTPPDERRWGNQRGGRQHPLVAKDSETEADHTAAIQALAAQQVTRKGRQQS